MIPAPLSTPALRALLTARLAARLGIAAADLDPRERFSRYGLDSAGATAWIAELGAELGRELSPTLVWGHPSVDDLARYLSGAAGPSGPSGGTAAPAAHPSTPPSTSEPIAIVGMACRFPGAPDLAAYWRLLCDGIDATREIPADRWDRDAWYDPDPARPGRINTRRGAFLDQIDGFDPLFFGISPREAAEMDPQQRLILELAWEALEDAGIPPRSLSGTRAGVFVGVISHDYAELHRMSGGTVTQHTGPGTSLSIVANRVSYLFGLRGPSLSVDTACSSSLVAVHLACQSLRSGEASLALAAGVNLVLSPELTVELTKFGGLSGDGRCKAFDASADGFARGEGAGLAVLKPLSRALADGDRIWCLIRGGAVNNDGFSNGLTAPSPQAQVEVLTEAYARAGVDPLRTGYVEAHGTGTRLGDPIEARSLAAVLCAGRDPARPLVLGSAKTNIAHQEGAAGIAGLIKLALAIHHRAIPPSLHFKTPNPDIPFPELRLRVATALEPWPRGETDEEPAVGGVSSFGWGGTNCHMVLEELPESRAEIVLLAAESPEGLRAVATREGTGREGGYRLAVSGRSRREITERLEDFLAGRARPGVAVGEGDPGRGPVFVYAGMGWQWPGMARDLLRSEPLVRARLERCDRLLRPLVGWSLLDLLVSGSAEAWNRAEVSVPGLCAIQVALTDLWRSWGIEPAAVIGHSCGEVAAAWAAGVLDLEEALRTAAEYGRILGRIEGRGAIGVVELPPEEAQARIESLGLGLEISGWLSPASASVAGEAGAVDRLVATVKTEGRFAARVATAVAAHTVQVEPHLDDFRTALAGLAPRRAAIPLMSTLTGGWLDRPMDGEYWAANLRRPVLFSQGVQKLLGEGCDLFLAVDAHPVLVTPLEQGFAHAARSARTLPSLRRGEDGRAVLFDSLGILWAAGQPVRVERLEPDSAEVGRSELLPLSARAPEALRDLARAMAAEIRVTGSERHPEGEGRAGRIWEGGAFLPPDPLGRQGSPQDDVSGLTRVGARAVVPTLSDLCHAAAVRRSHHEHRLAMTARSRGEMAERLEAFVRGEEVAGAAVGRRRFREERSEGGRLVFAFAGQGPQHPEMGRQLLAGEPVFRRVMEQCDEIARPWLGASFLEKMREEGALDHTEIAQPALFALQAGLAALWRSWGIAPDAVVGHSVGEIAAAWTAGALSLEDGVRVAVARGRAMEPALGKGKMAAVELPEDEVRAALEGYEDRVCVAAVNSPAATVLAGEAPALEELVGRLRSRGVTCRLLHVEYAFHSPQMEPCDRKVAAALADLHPQATAVPMISTVTGAAVDGTDLDGAYWARNVREPVRFAAAVEVLAGSGVFLEIGPHPVLSVAISQTLDQAFVLGSLRRGRDERETLLEALGRLWTLGLPVDWSGVHPDGGRHVHLPSYPFQRQRYWFERGFEVTAPAVPIPQPDPVSNSDTAAVERLLADQLDAFNRMVALQLDVLGRTGSA
jgi:acyl transferase domain-containing protein/acyl carrier protein